MTERFISLYKIKNLICLFQLIVYTLFLITANGIFLQLIAIFIPINIFLIALIYYKRLFILDIISAILIILILVVSTTLSPNEYYLKYPTLLLGLNAFMFAILFRGLFALKLIAVFNLVINSAVFIFGLKAGFEPSFGNQILSVGSRNAASAYLIFAMVYYLFFCYVYKTKINIPLVILFFVNCIILYGRSGVAISALLLIYAFYKRLNKLVFVFIASVIISSLSIFLSYIIENTNFSTGLDTPRYDLFKEYFRFIDSSEIIFGRSINQCCSLIISYGHNPHNSFISGHMFHGIAHTILLLTIFIIILCTRKLDVIFFACILYLRYSLDMLGLFHFADITLFSIFIYSYLIVFRKPTKQFHLNKYNLCK